MNTSTYEQASYERVSEARDFLLSRLAGGTVAPKIAIILGSGLGSFAERLHAAVDVPYSEIPHFPRSTVEGHSGRFLFGEVDGVFVAVMQGRVHAYEGYSPQQVTFPIRVLGLLGTKIAIVTNAAGAIRAELKPGQLVAIADHINLTGQNPLIGQNDARFGQRFFDMTNAYSKRLRCYADSVAHLLGIALPEGIYVGLSGPSYETPAEIRAFRALGADLVGMSTVHEVIVARHMGMEVLGISCVTNMAAGILDQPLNHQEVMETGERVKHDFSRLLADTIAVIHAGESRS
jgi:purine-nucleoside phosphorylase